MINHRAGGLFVILIVAIAALVIWQFNTVASRSPPGNIPSAHLHNANSQHRYVYPPLDDHIENRSVHVHAGVKHVSGRHLVRQRNWGGAEVCTRNLTSPLPQKQALIRFTKDAHALLPHLYQMAVAVSNRDMCCVGYRNYCSSVLLLSQGAVVCFSVCVFSFFAALTYA